MVHRIADEMYQRIVELFYDGLVELRFAALGDKVDVFPQIARKIPHLALEACEGCSDGKHADAHRVVAQPAGDTLQFLCDKRSFGIAARGRELAETRLDGDQFADDVHKTIEPLGRNANSRRRASAVILAS